MTRKLLILGMLGLFAFIFIKIGPSNFTQAANCISNCSLKEIGTLGLFDVFTPAGSSITVDVPYWVKITIKGRNTTNNSSNPPATPVSTTTTTSGSSDIMLMLDTTSSMFDKIPKYRNDNGEEVYNYEAVRDGVKRLIELSDENRDYFGLGSFRYCKDYRTNTVPVSWVYEDWSKADDKYRGFAALHLPLQSIKNKKPLFINTANNFAIGEEVTFCNSAGASGGSNGYPGGGTSVGAAVTVGSSQLAPILNDPKSVRRDGTSYRVSNRMGINGTNNGPLTRPNIPKYIVLASDGGEGVPPYVDDLEFDKNGRSILQTAKFYGIRIYSVAFAKPGNSGYQKLQRMAAETGGKVYSGTSHEEIVNSLEAIRNDITTTSTTNSSPGPTFPPSTSGTSAVVNEKINSNNFSIVTPTSSTFKIKTKSGATINCGANLDNCLSSRSSSQLDIKLPVMGDGDEAYIYFKVTPTTITSPGKAFVDSFDSKVNYSNGYQENLDNVEIEIAGAQAFYQTQNSGDVYSVGGYNNKLPDSATYMATGTYPGIVGYLSNILQLGNQTKVSSKDWRYRANLDAEEYTYGNLLAQMKNLTTLSTNRVTESGLYKFTGDFRVDSSTFNNLSGKKILIFVDGNLYINAGIRLPFDGNSSVTFIVRRNIGINASVKDSTNNEVRGIFLTDGYIDTACNSSFSGNTCSPAGTISDTSTLNLQGMFVAHSGFNLDRKGDPTNAIPGERFIYRPELLLAAGNQLGSVFYVWKEVPPDSL